jgi:hypothetical protein
LPIHAAESHNEVRAATDEDDEKLAAFVERALRVELDCRRRRLNRQANEQDH